MTQCHRLSYTRYCAAAFFIPVLLFNISEILELYCVEIYLQTVY